MSAREPLPPPGERVADRRSRAARVMGLLRSAYPDARCALDYESPFQLLIATVLSAQCTDERVNQVTPALFDCFPTAQAMAAADIEQLEQLVRPTGFYRNKAKSILGAARRIDYEFGGVVPVEMNDLLTIPGVARKTANVVISNCFPDHVDGIAVDTHVQRIARRLSLTRSFPTDKIERDLQRVIPQQDWNEVTHLMIDHGRAICRARSPRCGECPLASECPSSERFG